MRGCVQTLSVGVSIFCPLSSRYWSRVLETKHIAWLCSCLVLLIILINCPHYFAFLAVIGVGRTVIKYFAKDDGMLSFSNNKPVKIFSKGAGSNPDLWGVMVSHSSLNQILIILYPVSRSMEGGAMLTRVTCRRRGYTINTSSTKFLQNFIKQSQRKMMRLKYKTQKMNQLPIFLTK